MTTETTYCVCGHIEAEHDHQHPLGGHRKNTCSGDSVAVDRDSEGEYCSSRAVRCQCMGFYEADEWYLGEWRANGQLPHDLSGSR